MSEWAYYNLVENPFPQSASINPSSSDPKENGTIFQPSLLQDKVDELSEKIKAKLNLIYIMGLVHERGTGKSALLVSQYRKLADLASSGEKIWPCYIRCTSKDRPESFCYKILEEWHNSGFLWSIFKELLLSFSKATNSLSITQASVEVMFRYYNNPPSKINLRRFFHINRLSPIVEEITDYVNTTYGINCEIASILIESYLSAPKYLFKHLNARRIRGADEIDVFGEILKLTSAVGNIYHYIFIDQLEDLVAILGDRDIAKFALSMRRILEKSKNTASIVVTLHPDSDVALDSPSGKHLTTIAPLAPPHRIDLRPLNWRENCSVELAKTYLEYFRLNRPDDSLHPFTPNAIKLLTFCKEGCIRDILQRLYFTTDFALKNQTKVIDDNFIKENLLKTAGFILTKRKLKEFERETL